MMMSTSLKTDFLILGAGVIGLSIAKVLRQKFPDKRIVILEKEKTLGLHASGRNSGVLHTGFYYAADSLKAKFTLEGNRAWKKYCLEKNLPLNQNGKLVVAANSEEVQGVYQLYQKGIQNGIPLQLVSREEMASIEPNARTCDMALYSPETATVSPLHILKALEQELLEAGIEIYCHESFVKKVSDGIILSSRKRLWEAQKLINAAGLYADVIAQAFGFGAQYMIMPFKGLYLKYTGKQPPVKVNIYPVPDLNFPFLGVHLTVTAQNQVKLGPTAMPAFWRENYKGFSRFSFNELGKILTCQLKLLTINPFNFRRHAYIEMKKFSRAFFVAQGEHLVNYLDKSHFSKWTPPGIRAQLINKSNQELVQDFVVEGDDKSVHILNAVSPAFTCAIPFSEWVVDHYI